MDDSDEAMAGRLKLARERKGYLTATAAANALGVKEPTYLGHENGTRGFRASAARYARFFGVNLQWLIAGIGPMTYNTKHPVLELYEGLDESRQREVLNFLEFLKERR